MDGPGSNSWPLAAYTYLALHTTTMDDFTTALKLLEFIVWGVSSNVAAARVVLLSLSLLLSTLHHFVDDILLLFYFLLINYCRVNWDLHHFQGSLWRTD